MAATDTATANGMTWVQEDIPEHVARSSAYDPFVDHLVGNPGVSFRIDPGVNEKSGKAPQPSSVKAGIERSARRYAEMGFVTVDTRGGAVRAYFTPGPAPEKPKRKTKAEREAEKAAAATA